MDDGVVVFRLGDERYAIPLDCVRELSRVPAITPVPRLPAYVAGVANLRGNVVGVVDLRAVVGAPGAAPAPGARRMMVLSVDGVTAGVLVDVVEGVASLSGPLDAPVSTIPDWLRNHVRGHLHDGTATVTVLEPRLVGALQDRIEAETA